MNDVNKFTIIRDSREKASHGWFYDENAYCNGTIIGTLETGDYTIKGLENILCIERKESIDEFAHNCIEKRWQDCMKRMSQYCHKYILFEFSWDDVNNYPLSAKVPPSVRNKLKIPPKYIRRVINTARYDYGIHVLACNNRVKASIVAYRILSKAYELSLRC